MAKAKKKRSEPVLAPTRDKNINIRTAKNGYVVNIYGGNKDETYIAKNKSGVRSIVKKVGKI
jgi:hypothetical protein